MGYKIKNNKKRKRVVKRRIGKGKKQKQSFKVIPCVSLCYTDKYRYGHLDVVAKDAEENGETFDALYETRSPDAPHVPGIHSYANIEIEIKDEWTKQFFHSNGISIMVGDKKSQQEELKRKFDLILCYCEKCKDTLQIYHSKSAEAIFYQIIALFGHWYYEDDGKRYQELQSLPEVFYADLLKTDEKSHKFVNHMDRASYMECYVYMKQQKYEEKKYQEPHGLVDWEKIIPQYVLAWQDQEAQKETKEFIPPNMDNFLISHDCQTSIRANKIAATSSIIPFLSLFIDVVNKGTFDRDLFPFQMTQRTNLFMVPLSYISFSVDTLKALDNDWESYEKLIFVFFLNKSSDKDASLRLSYDTYHNDEFDSIAIILCDKARQSLFYTSTLDIKDQQDIPECILSHLMDVWWKVTPSFSSCQTVHLDGGDLSHLDAQYDHFIYIFTYLRLWSNQYYDETQPINSELEKDYFKKTALSLARHYHPEEPFMTRETMERESQLYQFPLCRDVLDFNDYKCFKRGSCGSILLNPNEPLSIYKLSRFVSQPWMNDLPWNETWKRLLREVMIQSIISKDILPGRVPQVQSVDFMVPNDLTENKLRLFFGKQIQEFTTSVYPLTMFSPWSCIQMENFNSFIPLSKIFEANNKSYPFFISFFLELITIIYNLIENGLVHGDLSPDNILIDQQAPMSLRSGIIAGWKLNVVSFGEGKIDFKNKVITVFSRNTRSQYWSIGTQVKLIDFGSSYVSKVGSPSLVFPISTSEFLDIQNPKLNPSSNLFIRSPFLWKNLDVWKLGVFLLDFTMFLDKDKKRNHKIYEFVQNKVETDINDFVQKRYPQDDPSTFGALGDFIFCFIDEWEACHQNDGSFNPNLMFFHQILVTPVFILLLHTIHIKVNGDQKIIIGDLVKKYCLPEPLQNILSTDKNVEANEKMYQLSWWSHFIRRHRKAYENVIEFLFKPIQEQMLKEILTWPGLHINHNPLQAQLFWGYVLRCFSWIDEPNMNWLLHDPFIVKGLIVMSE